MSERVNFFKIAIGSCKFMQLAISCSPKKYKLRKKKKIPSYRIPFKFEHFSQCHKTIEHTKL